MTLLPAQPALGARGLLGSGLGFESFFRGAQCYGRSLTTAVISLGGTGVSGLNSRVFSYLLADALLLAIALFIIASRRRGRPFFAPSEVEHRSLRRLLLASFLTLFAELAFIRWISVEVRVFAYFKNLALLLCFVGFGLGCALAHRARRWPLALQAFFALLLMVRIPLPRGWALEKLSQDLGAASDVEIWSAGNVWSWARFLNAAMLAAMLFLLLIWIFVPLGQIVSRQLDLAPKTLSAYSWNVLGSLAGILAFLGVCWLMLPPSVWLGMVLVGFALLQDTPRDRIALSACLLPLILVLHDPVTPDHFSFWTPYQQIEFQRLPSPQGGFWADYVWVNHTGYQMIVDLSPQYLAQNPKLLKEAPGENPYNLPFRFAVPSPRVLIVGSGTGNDGAAALRNGAGAVDAVEIDPAILALGRKEHPEHPYDSPRVRVHLTDARAFLKRTQERYDLVLFGLLDSHTQFSDYSNMRIDNFVYTLESFREAKERLNPNGVLFIKFQVNHPWMKRRLAEMLRQTFGKPPLVFFADSSYSVNATCFVISPSGRIEEALTADPRLTNLVKKNPVSLAGTTPPATTDDWPYLYQEGRWIPRTFFALGALVLLLAIALYFQIPDSRKQLPSLFFFSMGAGFLLLETQVISRLALYFGTTWQVNGIVISAVLIAILAANSVMEYNRFLLPRSWILAGLFLGLAAAYFLPLERVPGPPALAGILLAIVFSVPVFFAGLLFAREFRDVRSPSAALGANILGAVVGGLLENLSLVTGMRALLLVTMGFYALACFGLLRPQGVRSGGVPEPDSVSAKG